MHPYLEVAVWLVGVLLFGLILYGLGTGMWLYLFSPRWRDFRVPAEELASLPEEVWEIMQREDTHRAPDLVRSKIRHAKRLRATESAWNRAANLPRRSA